MLTLALDLTWLQPMAIGIGAAMGGILVAVLVKFLKAEVPEIAPTHPVAATMVSCFADVLAEQAPHLLDEVRVKAQAAGVVQGQAITDHVEAAIQTAVNKSQQS